MSDNVRDFAAYAATRDAEAVPSVVRCVCGSGWFTVTAVCIETDWRVSGYSGLPYCYECKRPIGESA